MILEKKNIQNNNFNFQPKNRVNNDNVNCSNKNVFFVRSYPVRGASFVANLPASYAHAGIDRFDMDLADSVWVWRTGQRCANVVWILRNRLKRLRSPVSSPPLCLLRCKFGRFACSRRGPPILCESGFTANACCFFVFALRITKPVDSIWV